MGGVVGGVLGGVVGLEAVGFGDGVCVRGESPATMWADAIEAAIRDRGVVSFTRVMVVAETDSTQDLARADGTPGLIVLADRQVAGRGRLGRAWHEKADLGVAASFTLDAAQFEAAALSVVSGVASLRACEAVLGRDAGGVNASESAGGLGLRWPNDVVEKGGSGRKLSGVLIERSPRLAIVGIGINVRHTASDFPAALGGRAVSLAMLGSEATRLEVVIELLTALDLALRQPLEASAAFLQSRDVLVGTRRTFEHAGRRYSGVVEAVRPTSHIQLRTGDGATVTLPALTTSMVHDA